MNKAERFKLHSVLLRLADNQEAILARLDGIEASQVMLGAMTLENQDDIKNLLLVMKETQRQQRASSGPDLHIVNEKEPSKSAE